MRPSRSLIGLVLGVSLAACGVSSGRSSGISVPAGPQLEEYGLAPRCQGQDSSCTDRAIEIAEEMLRQLGPPLPAAEAPAGDEAIVVPFTVQVDRDPPWEWRSTGGNAGTAGMATIDLEQFLSGRGDALVRLDESDTAYPVPGGLAEQLVETLFTR